MTRVNIAHAKSGLSGLIDRVLEGEEIVIARRNRPLVRLTPILADGARRRLGWARGQVVIADDFDETPEDFGDYVPHRRRGKAGR